MTSIDRLRRAVTSPFVGSRRTAALPRRQRGINEVASEEYRHVLRAAWRERRELRPLLLG
jgi:hypothetical protein